MNIQALYHIGIYTKDIEKSLEFYLEILGFKKIWEGMVDHPTGMIYAAVICSGEITIELVRPVDLNMVSDKHGPIQHLAFKVNNLKETMKELKLKGIRVFPENIESLPTFYKGIHHTFICGPSGERIELLEEM